MAFLNTLLDAVKDTLVVTSGGVEQLPFLLVWVVFPASLLFLLAFTFVSSRLNRRATFETMLAAFAAFFAIFAFVLYPLREALTPGAFCDALAAALPSGLAGAVACLRTWYYSLFYVCAELWGDVVLSLLFWGLANDITSVQEATVLYPLFGIGANVAQTTAGLALRGLGAATAAATPDADAAWGLQLRAVCVLTVGGCFGLMALHGWILRRAQAAGTATGAAAGTPAAVRAATPPPNLRDSLAAVASSPQIRCLAACALAQGVAQTLLDFAWKGHLRVLRPTPAGYAAYMGDVATATGVTTVLLMLLSSSLFARLGWRGAAGLLPRVLFFGGAVFFSGAVLVDRVAPELVPGLLPWVVLTGACLFVLSKATKYSLFKPAEESVYLRLGEAERTRGKAVVDVVANQAGKSGGSLFVQGSLLAFAGSAVHTLPLMLLAFLACAAGWMGAIDRLADVHEQE